MECFLGNPFIQIISDTSSASYYFQQIGHESYLLRKEILYRLIYQQAARQFKVLFGEIEIS
jgi:hypothetical protein